VILDFNKAPRQPKTKKEQKQQKLWMALFEFQEYEDRSAEAALPHLMNILRDSDNSLVRTIADMIDPKIDGQWKLKLEKKGKARPNKRSKESVLHMARKYQNLTEIFNEQGKKKAAAAARAVLYKQYGYSTPGAFDVAVCRALKKDGVVRKRGHLHKSRD
jgi:hypothetical protein